MYHFTLSDFIGTLTSLTAKNEKFEDFEGFSSKS